MLKEIYHAVVPQDFRQGLWSARQSGLRRSARFVLRRFSVALGKNTANVRLPHASLTLDLTDSGVGQVIYDTRQYEPNETRLITSLLTEGMTFVDVGANIGYFTLLASRLVGAKGSVLAMEPEPYNYRLLTANVRRNKCTNVAVVKCAAGASVGVAHIRRSGTNFGDHRLWSQGEDKDVEEIAVRTFDDAVEGQGLNLPDVVKIDTQGYECQVLQGMSRFLGAGHRAAILSEYWPYGMRQAGGDPRLFLDMLTSAGFRMTALGRGGRQVPVTIDTVDEELPPFDPIDPDGCFINLLLLRNWHN